MDSSLEQQKYRGTEKEKGFRKASEIVCRRIRGVKEAPESEALLECERGYGAGKGIVRVNYSDEQIRRLLKGKLGMNYAKPFVRDYPGPGGAENILVGRIEGVIKNLKKEGL